MRGLVLTVSAALLFAACGGDAEPTTTAVVATTGAVVTTTSPPPATTTTVATTTTTQASATTTTQPAESTTTSTSTTTTLPPSVCPAPAALADGTLTFSGGSGDFDGDGNEDTLLTYQASPDTWRVRVVFADGGGADAAIVEGMDFSPPQPIGGYDIDGDGADEGFLTVGSGASTAQVGLFDIAACVASRITTGGVPAVFPVGGSVGSVSGLSCPGDGSIHRNFAQFVSEDNYEGGFEPYTLAGAVLTPGFGDGAGFTADEAFALAVLDCGSLALP